MTTLDDMVTAARAGRFAWIDRGRHTMDFIHVDNLAAAVVAALDRGTDRAAYYVTDGSPTSIREFLTALLRTRGVDVGSARSVPYVAAASSARVMDRAYRVLRRRTPPPLTNWLVAVTGRDRSYDIGAARAGLRYTPVVDLPIGMASLMDRTAETSTAPGSRHQHRL